MREPLEALSQMHFLDLQQDFFLPLWRRVALVLFCLGWAVVEFVTAAPFWGVIFGAMGLYAAWQLFFAGWPGGPRPDGSNQHKAG